MLNNRDTHNGHIGLDDQAGLQRRRSAYFEHVRGYAPAIFKKDGSYQPETEADGRIAYWVLPAFLNSKNTAEREWGLRIYSKGAGWENFDIFMTSSIAAHLARHYEDLSDELRRRSEEHLSRFTIADEGRRPCANAYDYMFHGFNDNMPAMATRTMILAGDLLDRRDFTDAGLFHLEGLAAHFQRRGLLSEYTSPTYTPICLASLLDIAECTRNSEARELAQACADRILLDIFGHWHRETATSGGTTARAYTVDITQTLSVLNAYMWYVTGDPLNIDPSMNGYDGPMHHAGNRGFNLAQFVEVMNASHAGVLADLRDFTRKPRIYPYNIRATADWSGDDPHGGCRGVQTRSFQQNHYWLATSSTNSTGAMAGQALLLHGALAALAGARTPASWRDRVVFWTRLMADSPDYGEPVYSGETSPHSGSLSHASKEVLAQPDHVNDWGCYHTVQQNASAMLVGGIAATLDGRILNRLNFSFLATTFCGEPEEIYDGLEKINGWTGEVSGQGWQFLRYGDVYLAIRIGAMSYGIPCPVRRTIRNGYLRLETELIGEEPKKIDETFRRWTDFGFLIDISSREEIGSFENFRQAVHTTNWEFHHNFYRSSRWITRHGELHIIDSTQSGTARFIAIDGKTEEDTFFSATGLDPSLTRLFPDGHHLIPRRTLYRSNIISSPFYDRPGQIVVGDHYEDRPHLTIKHDK